MENILTWFEARESCIVKGGRLAEIDNAEINTALKGIAFGKVYRRKI